MKPVKTAAEIKSDLQNEYQAKLLHGEIILPDPYYLTSAWFGEDEGMLVIINLSRHIQLFKF